jgi:hypothetical protein
MGIGGTAYVIHDSYETGDGRKGQHEGSVSPTNRAEWLSVRDSGAFFVGNG